MRAFAGVAVVAAFVLAACGGSGSATPVPAAPSAAPPLATDPAMTVPPAEATPAATEAPTVAPAASLTPGSIAFRVVNLTNAPVDVFIRTQGLVEAAPAATGLAPGAVTDDLFPPEPGAVVVLPAGSGDPTCVSSCDFLGETSTGFGEGDRRLLVISDEGAAEYWERPDASSLGAMANALAPADPAQALLIAEADAVSDAAFGLRVAFAGSAGCAASTDGAEALLGGTAVRVYPVDPAGIDIVLHDSADRDCSGATVGGPFPVTVAAGTRTMLLLWGSMGAMQGVAVPLP